MILLFVTTLCLPLQYIVFLLFFRVKWVEDGANAKVSTAFFHNHKLLFTKARFPWFCVWTLPNTLV